MRLAFYRSRKSWCIDFAEQFAAGVRVHGDTVVMRQLEDEIDQEADAVLLMGAGYKDTYERVKSSGKPTAFLDKGWYKAKDFSEEGAYFHISVGGYRPIAYVGKWGKPGDRLDKFNWRFKPWRRHGQHVLLAWSSFKYHDFHGLPPPHEHAAQIVRAIRKRADIPVIYRQKPNQPRHDVKGAISSEIGSTLEEDLEGAFVLVTVGSSACLHAMLAGVPSICLGETVISPICSNSIDDVLWPRLACNAERMSALCDLSYCQWHLDEYASGEAWKHVKPLLENFNVYPSQSYQDSSKRSRQE